ncbi:PREDICTED: peroxisome assembly protein 12 [Diuraphis noxia]|uniref:peroxisome assembly protein 12 n=1 Tax=Diuraphis noxia TaxID=143948 RepID=UPI00076399C6|nr:PREDICTED: peroxisome assembly protein 12 [Diuraphis noxia]
MAEKAAHHTKTIINRPSIFEVIAQENLSSIIYPALKKCFIYITHKNPGQLEFLNKYFDEVFLALNTVCQYQYLKKYGGTFSEHFYDLTRVSSITNSKPDNYQFYLSLALVVCIPYLRNKCDMYIDQLQMKYKLQLKHKVFITLNKIVHTCWETLRLIYYIKYINGSSQSHSPLLTIVGVVLTYNNIESSNNESLSQLSIKESIKNYLLYGLSHSLELGAFFIQFLNWWHSENLQSKFIAYPIPNPPKENDTYKSVRNTNKCPICENERKMPTALTVSGFVYCYKCLHKHLVGVYSRCPVTKLPASMQDMIRIYTDN